MKENNNNLEFFPNQQLVQQNIEKQVGNMVVALCVKDAIIEQLQQENAALKKGLLTGFHPPPLNRPETGQDSKAPKN